MSSFLTTNLFDYKAQVIKGVLVLGIGWRGWGSRV